MIWYLLSVVRSVVFTQVRHTQGAPADRSLELSCQGFSTSGERLWLLLPLATLVLPYVGPAASAPAALFYPTARV